jgi:hypothetical protein
VTRVTEGSKRSTRPIVLIAAVAGIPVVAIGDSDNEIGMGNVAGQVKQHVPFGADGSP